MRDLKSLARKGLWVRLPPLALNLKKNHEKCLERLNKREDPGGGTAIPEDILTSRFNPSYLSFVRRSE